MASSLLLGACAFTLYCCLVASTTLYAIDTPLPDDSMRREEAVLVTFVIRTVEVTRGVDVAFTTDFSNAMEVLLLFLKSAADTPPIPVVQANDTVVSVSIIGAGARVCVGRLVGRSLG